MRRCIAIVMLCLSGTGYPGTGLAGTAGPVYLVLGSFSHLQGAEQQASRLTGELARTVGVKQYGNFYRLVIGPVGESGAEELGNWLQERGTDYWVWRIPAPVPEEGINDEGSGDAVPTDVSIAGQEDPLRVEEESVSFPDSSLSLLEAIHLGLERNLRLLREATQTVAARGRTGEARSALLPSLGLQLGQTAIDRDRAEASNGRAPQYQTFVSLSLQQLVYSDDASAAYQIQQVLQQAADIQYEAALQDKVLEIATAYLSVLRAESLVRVFRDDLQLSLSNLDRANTRLQFGVASKAEVYRWQTRVSSSRRDLVNAEARARSARVGLNELLNHPLQDDSRLQTPRLDDDTLILADQSLRRELASAVSRTGGYVFWRNLALEHAPELALVRKQLSARDRELLAARRSLTRPTVLLAAEYRKRVSKRGAGIDQLDFTFPGFDERIGGTTDEIEWNAALNVDLPLYAGGERLARIRTASAEVNGSRLEVDEALLNVQARLLAQYHVLLAALVNIDNAREAATASASNLELVIDSYSEGVVTFIDLLDAQLAALRSGLDAANAEYDFLIEYFRLQRITGRFDILLSPEDRDKLKSELLEQLVLNRP